MGQGAGDKGRGTKSGGGAQGAPQTTTVRFQTRSTSFEATLDGGLIATALLERLPITAAVQHWGEEIYFDVPVKMANSRPTTEVRVGDIAYWPDGPCLCIFFGRTPASKAGEPRPASEVTIIGRTLAPPARLRSAAEGETITVTHASAHQDQAV